MANHSIDRRKFTRVAPPPHEFFAYCHETKRTMMVMDIGMGGFKIESYPWAGSRPESVMIDIYSLSHERFHLAGILCRVVYDISRLTEERTFSGSESRICGLQCEKLTKDQKDRLEQVINLMDPKFRDKPKD